MTYQDLLNHFRTEADAGRAIGLDRQTVHAWQKRGKVPIDKQMKFEVATAGALKADIPPELRRSVAA